MGGVARVVRADDGATTQPHEIDLTISYHATDVANHRIELAFKWRVNQSQPLAREREQFYSDLWSGGQDLRQRAAHLFSPNIRGNCAPRVIGEPARSFPWGNISTSRTEDGRKVRLLSGSRTFSLQATFGVHGGGVEAGSRLHSAGDRSTTSQPCCA